MPGLMALSRRSTSYPIAKSLRFNDDDSARLTRTPGAASNRRTWTFSAWLKLGNLGKSYNPIFLGGADVSTITGLDIGNTGNDQLRFYMNGADTLITTLKLRDPTAWFHLVVAVDTTQATNTNRIKIYINNVQITAFATASWPAQNTQGDVNNTKLHVVGGSTWLPGYFDGYMAEINFVDGLALTPTSFGKIDPTTLQWIPKKYSGAYSTNGFYLNFNNTAALGTDGSGNGNNYTPANFSVVAGAGNDSLTDTPTNNYPAWSPINKGANVTNSNGNLCATATSGAGQPAWESRATMPFPSSGKWYFEYTYSNVSGDYPVVGMTVATKLPNSTGSYFNDESQSFGYFSTGEKLKGGIHSAYGSAMANGDVLNVAVDMTNGKIWFGKNGVWQGSGDPAAGTNATYATVDNTATLFPAQTTTTATGDVNFGQRAFAYTPPTGFKALNSNNITAPSVKKSASGFDIALYTGSGATKSITGLLFQPNMVWQKSRSATGDHVVTDSVRGVTKQVFPSLPNAEQTDADNITSFNADGFTMGTGVMTTGSSNVNTVTYLSLCWKESATYGFDIVLYTGTGASQDVSHGAGGVPGFFLSKNRGGSNRWLAYHSTYASARYAYLNETFIFDTTNANLRWSANFTSTLIKLAGGEGNSSANTYVGYVWTPIEGFSAFTSYVGNLSTDGPVVYLGFKPRFLLIKDALSVAAWDLIDTAREPNNPLSANLYQDNTAEAAQVRVDVLSNGFKVRDSNTLINNNSGNMVVVAFAEMSGKYARAH